MKQHYYYNEKMQNKQKTNPALFSLQLGFFAGLIWGGLRLICYELSFTSHVPGFLLEPFMKHNYLESFQGQLVGWGAFILFSIICSFIYTFTMKKLIGPWPGVVYGVLWWVLLFVVLGPMIGLVPPVTQSSYNAITTDCCLFLLWGLFIGYTTATEFNDERLREPESDGSESSGSTGQAETSPSS